MIAIQETYVKFNPALHAHFVVLTFVLAIEPILEYSIG